MIEIKSNGSKWHGQPPDTIETLLEVLSEEPLNPVFEEYGGAFIEDWGAIKHFHGNFLKLSHVFDIRTDDPAIISKLTEAITKNRTYRIKSA